MRTFLRNNAIALVALFVAMGGTGYAAAKLTGRDVKPDTLTGKQVKEETLKATRIVARPTGDDVVVADPPPSPGPPQDPADYGTRYPVTPATFRLPGPGLLKPTGQMKVEPVGSCVFGFVTAYIFSNDRFIGLGGGPLPLPEGQDSLPIGFAVSLQRASRGNQRIQVRVASSCIFGGTGAAAQIEEVDLSVLAYR
jgi:hypothetical protein